MDTLNLNAPSDQGINIFLKDKYGLSVDGKPKFRLIWTTNVTEKRFSEFTDYTDHNLIRRVKEVRDTLKYPFNQDRWVLEAYAPGDYTDLKDRDNYDSFYFFQDKDGNALPLNRDVIEIFIWFYIHRDKYTRDVVTRRNEIEAEMQAKEDAEREYIRQKLGENAQVPHLMDLVW